MKKLNQDRLFKEMASRYVETYGEKLKDEMRQLDQDGQAFITPGMDQRVKHKIDLLRLKRHSRGIGLLAACVALVLLVPVMSNLLGSDSMVSPSPASSAAERAVEEAATAESSDMAPRFEMIPLSFPLPENFSVSGVEQDLEKSIYFLTDLYQDDVVLTMEKLIASPSHQGLAEITINDEAAYGMSGPDYSFLTFAKDDVLYVLTCKYDINTLVGLGGSIL